jgi:predicted dehydrogenase
MRTDERARIAVIGLGRIGRLHARNLAVCVPGAELTGVADFVESIAHEVGRLLGVRWTCSVDDLLTHPRLDGVIIATPSASHPELVERVAAAGKHVFCEKPLGLDPDRCASAVAAAEEAGVALQVGFHRHFDREWEALRSALDSGALGTLTVLRCWHRNAAPPPVAGLGDLFTDLGVHDFDAVRRLAGEVTELYATATPGGDAAIVTLRCASGTIAVVELHRSAGYGFDAGAELIGTDATVRTAAGGGRGATELLRDGVATTPVPADHVERHAAAYVRELEHFAAVARGRENPLVTGRDAFAALRIARAAARSAATGAPGTVAEHAGHRA